MRHLIITVIFGLLGCSSESLDLPISHSPEPGVVHESPTMAPNESPVKVIGEFTDIKGDGEHQWGYSASFWSQDGKIHGLISGTSGLSLIGDTPVGILENVQFDPVTKALSFRAKLSLGISDSQSGAWSRDTYDFDGTLTERRVKGTLRIENELCANKCPREERIDLRLSNDRTRLLDDYSTHAEWQAAADKILKRRGPTTGKKEVPIDQKAFGHVQTEWLEYSPAVVELEGILIIKTFFGPPNFGEEPETDSKEETRILSLDKPINVRAKDETDNVLGPSVENVRELQLVFNGPLRKWVGKKLRVKGTLFHAHTGHHHTDVLLDAESISLAPSD